MKTTALAAALFVAALGVAPFAAAQQTPIHLTGSNQPALQNTPYPGTLKIHVDARPWVNGGSSSST